MGSLRCLLGALGGLQSGPFGKGLERQKRVWGVLEKARKEENRIKGSFKTILSPLEKARKEENRIKGSFKTILSPIGTLRRPQRGLQKALSTLLESKGASLRPLGVHFVTLIEPNWDL
jgi:hypothetical protein